MEYFILLFFIYLKVVYILFAFPDGIPCGLNNFLIVSFNAHKNTFQLFFSLYSVCVFFDCQNLFTFKIFWLNFKSIFCYWKKFISTFSTYLLKNILSYIELNLIQIWFLCCNTLLNVYWNVYRSTLKLV